MTLHDLFPRILNMSLTASAIITAILLIRLPLKKAPKVFSYALWAVVLFRLLCPVSIQTPVGVVPQAEVVASEEYYTLADKPVSFSGALLAAGNTIGNAAGGGPSVQYVYSAEKDTAGLPVVVTASRLDVWALLGKYVVELIWIGGIAALVLYSAVQYIGLRRRLVGAVPLRDNIYLADHIGSPFVMGLFRPKIYLPSSLAQDEQAYIILHEQHHIRRGDHVLRVLAFAALCIHWFNPLVWAAFVLSGKDMEMSCDEAVMKQMDDDIRAEYSASLLRLATGRRIVAGTPLAFGEGDTKARVKNVMKYKKPAFWIVLAAVIICVMAAGCFATSPAQATDGSRLLAEDGSGLPAPRGGEDPYADLAPAERAAAFLKNADTLDYELSPVLMCGRYVVPVMEYVPPAQSRPDDPMSAVMLDRTEYILGLLHDFDLSVLEPCELTNSSRYETKSGVIRVGDACCRVTTWYCDDPEENPDADSVLAFTFTDGTMCAFNGGAKGLGITGIAEAIETAGGGRYEAMSATGGKATVTRLSTGESRVSSAGLSAYIECIFDNTVRLAEPVKDGGGSFDWQVSVRDGATYLFDQENLLIKAENGRVFPLSGVEEVTGNTGLTIEAFLRGMVLNGFDDAAPEDSADPNVSAQVRMETVTADDLKHISYYGFQDISAEELAPALNAAAGHSVDREEDIWMFWELDAYLSGGPDSYSSNDENFCLQAGLAENIVQIRYSDGSGSSESLVVKDEALYWLIRNSYRVNGIIDPSFEQYRDIIGARAQEAVEESAEYNIGSRPFTGYEVTSFEPADTFEADGERYDVYRYGLVFTTDDPTKVGWAGGMGLDSELRVYGYDTETYFVVRTGGSGRQEHRFLAWDLYFGPDEAAARENAWTTIQTAFEAS